jgi:ribosomal-protein-alanine N-acetyltransferase
MGATIVETPRLRLRKLTVDDAGFVFRLINDPAFLANIGSKGVRSLEDARRFILEGPWTNQRRPGYGQFLIELKDEGEPVGVCGLLYRDTLDVTDIGFAILAHYRRRGLAFEAADAVMEYGHSTLGIASIVALTSHENLPSIGVLEKLGMKFERTVKMSDGDPGTALFA